MVRDDAVYSTLALGTAAFHLFVSPSSWACMIGCTRKHSCDPGLQQNLLRHNYHTTPALAPERSACWSRLKRLVQLSCETRSVPYHTHHRSYHLVSRAPHLPRCIACCCFYPLVATACLMQVFVVSSFWFSVLRLGWQSLQASIARQVEYLQFRPGRPVLRAA